MQMKTLQEIKSWYSEDHPRGPYQYELGDRMGKSQSSIKMHLFKLKQRGLVRWKESGSLAITALGESILE